jgi:predicted transposase YdaD
MPGNAHELLFRSTFSQIERAASILRRLLPPSLVDRIDWSTLMLPPGSFVDEVLLAERFTDLTLSVDLSGRPASMYLLFFHESDARGRLVLWHVRSDHPLLELLRMLASWVDLMRDVHQASSREDVLALIRRYVSSVNARLDVNESVGMLTEALFAEGKAEIASIADELREEGQRKGFARGVVKGRLEGRREGRLEGRRELVLKLLRTRFGELPEVAVARVNAADVVQLDLWAERVLSVPTLADVLERD